MSSSRAASSAGSAWTRAARPYRVPDSKSLQMVLALAAVFVAVSAMAAPLQLATTDSSVATSVGGGGNSVNPIISRDGRYVLFASTADNLALTSSNTPFSLQGSPKLNVFLRDRARGTTILVSQNLAGTGGGNGNSIPVDISTNGQYVLFESSASDLVSGDTNNATDVFVRDLVGGTNILVSRGFDGGIGIFYTLGSGQSSMTPDGRYVVFASAAANLVANDTNGIQDIFVRDMQNGATVRASSDALAAKVSLPADYADQVCSYSFDSPVISPDGRYIGFIATFTPFSARSTQFTGVVVSDLVAGTATLITSNLLFTDGNGSATYDRYSNLAMSDNGQFLAFESATNASGGNGIIQRYNLQTGLTDIVCSNAMAAQTSLALNSLDMTPDGRFIAFVVYSNYDAAIGSYRNSFIYIWDAETARSTLVSCDTNGEAPVNSLSDSPAIDSTGRYVAFVSDATTLTTNAVSGGFHLYLRARNLRDPLAGSTTLLDADTNGFGFAKDFLNPPRLSSNGRFIAFDCTGESDATNVFDQAYNVANRSLVPNDRNHGFDVFVTDFISRSNELISARQPALPSQTPAQCSPEGIFSVDTGGRFIAFASAADSLAHNYGNRYRSVFVHDLLGGTNVLVSVDSNGLANVNGTSSDPSVSGDGRYVVFTSSATNLVAGDSNNVLGTYHNGQDVFLRDLQTGTTTLVSVDADPVAANNSYSPVISANGRYVLFQSSSSIATITGASSVGAGDHLFLRDLAAGATYDLGGSYNLHSMTPDGHFVAFGGFSATSTAKIMLWDSQAGRTIYTNTDISSYGVMDIVVSPDGNRIAYASTFGQGLFVADRAASSIIVIDHSLQYAGYYWNPSARPQFSGDSRFMVYSSLTAMVPQDTNRIADVYLYDFVTHSNFLVSQSSIPGVTNGPSDFPTISSDGRFVAYRSMVTNTLVVNTNLLGQPIVPNVFLYDRQTGVTTLLSANAAGAPGNSDSFAPQFSGDGRTVVFQTWASDLVPGDYNQSGDLVAVKIATSNPTPVFAGQIVFAPGSGQSPTLTWPAVSGASYQVQFKDSLTDSTWQPLNGNVWVAGGSGYATDLAPSASQRFYRVQAN